MRVRNWCLSGKDTVREASNPNGWSAQAMPYLMEYDNWGGLVVEDPARYSREELAFKDWWDMTRLPGLPVRTLKRGIIFWNTHTAGWK